MDLKSNLVAEAPPTVYYVPNFITEEEEKRIIEQVNSAPKPKWTQLSHRRLQNWGGVPHPKGMIAESLPDWLLTFTERIGKLDLFGGNQPNHVLVNEYLPGQGIMPHLDGPLFHPTVTTISCGSHTMLEFYHPRLTAEEGTKLTSLLLERCSLVVLQDEMYTKYLHTISDVQQDIVSGTEANLGHCEGRYEAGEKLQRSTRLSLTVRHVPHTSKLRLQLSR